MIAFALVVGSAALLWTTSAEVHEVAAKLAAEPPISDADIVVRALMDVTYPPEALIKRVEGAVVLRAHLDDGGGVESVEPISGHELLVRVAVDNLKTWRFAPNTRNQAIVIYDFRIDGSCSGVHSYYRLLKPNLLSVLSCRPMMEG